MANERSLKHFLINGLATPFRKIAQFQLWVANTVKKIPGWPEIEAAATQVTWPLRTTAAWALRRLPWLERMEWLFETKRLATYNPVMLAATILFTTYRGLATTNLGHIGTDSLIYPALGIISGFNPFLGCFCALCFAAGDIVQKLLINDIYGTPQDWVGHYFNIDYWGAIFGYIFAYSAPFLMGLLPGMTSRAFRHGTRLALRKVFYKQAAATADGATPGGPRDAWQLFARRRADGAVEWTVADRAMGPGWIAHSEIITRDEAEAALEGIRSGELQVEFMMPEGGETAATEYTEQQVTRGAPQEFFHGLSRPQTPPATSQEHVLRAMPPDEPPLPQHLDTERPFAYPQQPPPAAHQPPIQSDVQREIPPQRFAADRPPIQSDVQREIPPRQFAADRPPIQSDVQREIPPQRFAADRPPIQSDVQREIPPQRYPQGHEAPPTIVRETPTEIEYSDGTHVFVDRVQPATVKVPPTVQGPPTIVRETPTEIEYSDGTHVFVDRVQPAAVRVPPTVISNAGGEIKYSDGTTAMINRVAPVESAAPPTIIRQTPSEIQYSDGTTAMINRVQPAEMVQGAAPFVDRRQGVEELVGERQALINRREPNVNEQLSPTGEASGPRRDLIESVDPQTGRKCFIERVETIDPQTGRKCLIERPSDVVESVDPQTGRKCFIERVESVDPQTGRKCLIERPADVVETVDPQTGRKCLIQNAGSEPQRFVDPRSDAVDV
ncbi:MAG TPA: hypothetical protein VEA16_15655, partial [Vicinamibacterales bacterium]|nr:hypothetical protein [Vicinamibacterales bacterium]